MGFVSVFRAVRLKAIFTLVPEHILIWKIGASCLAISIQMIFLALFDDLGVWPSQVI